MGCCGSKKAVAIGGCDTTPNDHTGLSECDCKHLRESWAYAMPDNETKLKNGIELLVQWFTTYPHHQTKFPSLEGVDFTDAASGFAENEAVQDLAQQHIEKWSDIVYKSSEDAALSSYFVEIFQLSEMQGEDYEEFETVLVPWMRSILEDKFTSDVEEAWGRLARCMTNTIRTYLEEQNAGAQGQGQEEGGEEEE